MRWICVIIGHRPDRSRISERRGDLHTVCGRCATTMTRRFGSRWNADDETG